MTTELAAAAAEMSDELPLGEQFACLLNVNEELRRKCARLRKENDDMRHLIIEMRKRVSEVMHSSMDDYK
jgi:CRISPR/Cas system-associated exonuclease Cas4 (RecB family)